LRRSSIEVATIHCFHGFGVGVKNTSPLPLSFARRGVLTESIDNLNDHILLLPKEELEEVK